MAALLSSRKAVEGVTAPAESIRKPLVEIDADLAERRGADGRLSGRASTLAADAVPEKGTSDALPATALLARGAGDTAGTAVVRVRAGIDALTAALSLARGADTAGPRLANGAAGTVDIAATLVGAAVEVSTGTAVFPAGGAAPTGTGAIWAATETAAGGDGWICRLGDETAAEEAACQQPQHLAAGGVGGNEPGQGIKVEIIHGSPSRSTHSDESRVATRRRHDDGGILDTASARLREIPGS